MIRTFAAIAALLATIIVPAGNVTADDGLAIFASRGGRVSIESSSGQRYEAKRFDIFSPAGQTVTVSHTGFAAIVLSNGCSIYLSPGTELTFSEMQQPHPGEGFFQRAFEPGHSNLDLILSRGAIAISHPNRRASSRIQVQANNTLINLLSSAAIVERSGADLEVTVINGSANLTDGGGQRSDTIQAGLRYTTSDVSLLRGRAERLTPAERRSRLALLELADTSAAMIIFEFYPPESGRPPAAAIARDPAHFKKRPVNDYMIGGRNF